jgi:hypothetical protein
MLKIHKELILKLADSEHVVLEEREAGIFQVLVTAGLVVRVDPPKSLDMESQYESLQGTHQAILETRASVDRIQRQHAPRPILSFLGQRRTVVEEPDALHAWEGLQRLGLQVRGVEGPEDVPGQFERIQNRLRVEGRECLDRLAALDRQIEAQRRLAAEKVLVEGQGYFMLSEAGERALPESGVMDELTAVLHAVSGPRRHRMDDFAHYRDDPASLVSYLVERTGDGEPPASAVSTFEALAESFSRLPAFSEVRSVRPRNAFLIRLLRFYRDQPKSPFIWCNRERINALVAGARHFLPSSALAAGWHLPAAADLHLAHPEAPPAVDPGHPRVRLAGRILDALPGHIRLVALEEGLSSRLALALSQDILARGLEALEDQARFLRLAMDLAFLGSQAAPGTLTSPGAKLVLGYHLAHAGAFTEEGLAGAMAAFRGLAQAFGDRTPAQVLLHYLEASRRLEALGSPLPAAEFARMHARILANLQRRPQLARTFAASARDDAFLAANLTVRASFPRDPLLPPCPPGPGMTSLYEPSDATRPPLLGLPFGTLLLD